MSNVTLVQSRSLCDFEEIVTELSPDLGERFHYSIENWCGIGKRPYPLAVWEVFLAKADSVTVGLCSYYQQEEDPEERFWIGWIGVLKPFRRGAIGTLMLSRMEALLIERGAKVIMVYAASEAAAQFYESAGYQRVGTFSDIDLPQAGASGDEPLLQKIVSAVDQV